MTPGLGCSIPKPAKIPVAARTQQSLRLPAKYSVFGPRLGDLKVTRLANEPQSYR